MRNQVLFNRRETCSITKSKQDREEEEDRESGKEKEKGIIDCGKRKREKKLKTRTRGNKQAPDRIPYSLSVLTLLFPRTSSSGSVLDR